MVREECMLCRHGSVTVDEHNGLESEQDETSRLSSWFSLRILGGLVGKRGFEPRASCSRSMRATRLRHFPILGFHGLDIE
jgi:hypothetical protein